MWIHMKKAQNSSGPCNQCYTGIKSVQMFSAARVKAVLQGLFIFIFYYVLEAKRNEQRPRKSGCVKDFHLVFQWFYPGEKVYLIQLKSEKGNGHFWQL